MPSCMMVYGGKQLANYVFSDFWPLELVLDLKTLWLEVRYQTSSLFSLKVRPLGYKTFFRLNSS